jgi:hypothetical protein
MRLTRWFTLALALATPAVALAEGEKSERKAMDEKSKQKSEQDTVHVRSHVVPAVAGIQAADKAVAALFELSGEAQLDPADARRTVMLAKQGLTMAIERTNALDDKVDLSSDAQNEADRATTKLREARTTLTRLENRIGKKQARISRNAMEEIRENAKDLHSDLSDAENAVERVAKAYDVPTDLEFEG